MQLNRSRLCLLISLVAIYLGAVLFLSALTLHDSTAPSVVSVQQTRLNRNNRNNHASNSLIVSSSDNRKDGRGQQYYYGEMIHKAPFEDKTVTSNKRNFDSRRIRWCSELKYRQPAGDPVALASFPGSGNTWLRYLLQQSTGILTGSVYKDYGLLKNGFPAENTTDGSVLVVKTHEWGASARISFKKAVLLVRSPAAAIQAEFNRQSGGHIGFAAPERYKRTKGKYWEQFVRNKIVAWRKTNMDWLNNFAGPTHVIFYEQLVDSPRRSLKSLLNFLEVPIDDARFNCALKRKEGIYRRKKRLLTFDPFSDQMKRKLMTEQQLVYEAIYRMASPSAS